MPGAADAADTLMARYQGLLEDITEGLDESLDAVAAAHDNKEAALHTLTSKVVRMQYLSKLQDECRTRIEV